MNATNTIKHTGIAIPVTVKRNYQTHQPCTVKPQTAQQLVSDSIAELASKTLLFRLTEAPAKPPFLDRILQLLRSHGFDERSFRIGITGFGTVKTHMAEIGLVSTTDGFYNLHLGGNPTGNQLSKVYRINASEGEILQELNSRLLPAFKLSRNPGETFGEFVNRKRII
jgi:hypothetical protein